MPRICKIFEVTRTIYSNSERSEQFLETECFLTCFTFMFSFYGKFIICIFCWKICFVNKFVNNVWFCFEMKKPSIDCRPWNTTQNIWGFIWIVCVLQSLYDIRKYLAFMYKPWLILNSIYCQLCIWNHDKDLMSLNGHEKANEPENESFAYLWCYVQLVHIPATVKAWHRSVVNFLLGFSTPFDCLNFGFIPKK